MPPLVSICLPNLNTRPFLEPRMASILAQTLTDWELIIGDSHSEDGAWEYFQIFRGDPRIRLEQIPRAGIYAGWNECLRRATGKYVWIATSDDTAEPRFLERLVGVLEKYPDAAVAFCPFRRIDAEGRIIPKAKERDDFDVLYGDWLRKPHRRRSPTQLILEYCLADDWGNMAAVVFRRDLLAQAGWFETGYGAIADYAWRMKAALFTDVLYVPEYLATWRVHAGQATARHPADLPRLSLELVRRTLAESAARLPAEWKREPRWRARLMRVFTGMYLKSYGLDRQTLKTDYRRFLRGCAQALRREPFYLAARLLSGLTWQSRWYVNEYAYAQTLIREWRAPWPPEEITLA